MDLALDDAGQEALLLLIGAVGHDRRPDGVGREERHGYAGPLRLVEEDVLVSERTALTAVLLRPGQPEPAVGAELADEILVERAAAHLTLGQ